MMGSIYSRVSVCLCRRRVNLTMIDMDKKKHLRHFLKVDWMVFGLGLGFFVTHRASTAYTETLDREW